MAHTFKPYSRTQNLKLSTYINGQVVYFNSLQERFAYESIANNANNNGANANEDKAWPCWIVQDGDYVPYNGEPLIWGLDSDQDFNVTGGLGAVRFAFENGGTVSPGDYIIGYWKSGTPTSGPSEYYSVFNQVARKQGSIFLDTEGQQIAIRNNGTDGGSQGRMHVYGGPHATHATVNIPGEYIGIVPGGSVSFRNVRKRAGFAF